MLRHKRKMQKIAHFTYLIYFYLLLFIFFFFSCARSFNDSYEDEEVMVTRSMFPLDFVFGVATSAYQIEGAYLEDGKGLNNWDVYSRIPGNIKNGDNGYIADDHYHRYMEDIEILEHLGVDAYRFSISWARILPRGRFGGINPLGIMFYNKVIDHLLLKGIEPFVTIHHEDLPYELEERYGSWLSTQMQEDFVHFAKICFESFGDRVKHWITMNEPNLYAQMAYMYGLYPPGHCSQPFVKCSSGNSDVDVSPPISEVAFSSYMGDSYLNGGVIGIVLTAINYEAYRNDEFNHQAVERAFAFNIAWVMDPLVYGEYPPLMRKYLEDDLPKFSKEETDLVKGSVDFFGINHYSSLYAIDCLHYPSNCTTKQDRAIRGFVGLSGYQDGIPIGEKMGVHNFFVVPRGMENIIDYVRMRYPNIAIYMTENGYSPPQEDLTNKLEDFKRIKYHKAYLAALSNAIRKGAKVKGYFAWTFMDNFEWISGYDITFGLYYVDRRTLKRTPKFSARWYAHFLANKTLPLLECQFPAPKLVSTH